MSGKWDGSTLPETVIEWMFASEYGWSLDTIRQLHPRDYRRHLIVCQIAKSLEAKKHFS